MMRARRCGLVFAQASCAALAFSTAARNSAFDASATLAWTSPVIGSKTSAVRPDEPLTSRPPMKCSIERMCSSKTLCFWVSMIFSENRIHPRVKPEGRLFPDHALDAGFGRHLAVFTAFGKGFRAQRFCENAGYDREAFDQWRKPIPDRCLRVGSEQRFSWMQAASAPAWPL